MKTIRLQETVMEFWKKAGKLAKWAEQNSGWWPMAKLAKAIHEDLHAIWHTDDWTKPGRSEIYESEFNAIVQKHLDVYHRDVEAHRYRQQDLLRKQICTLTAELDKWSTNQYAATIRNDLAAKITSKKLALDAAEMPPDFQQLQDGLNQYLDVKIEPQKRLAYKP
jgi:hypothetical protein